MVLLPLLYGLYGLALALLVGVSDTAQTFRVGITGRLTKIDVLDYFDFDLAEAERMRLDAVEELLILKPDFQRRGRILIKHYIKFDEIVERMELGLKEVGLTLE